MLPSPRCLQVMARYSCMDIVDHGPEVIEHMCNENIKYQRISRGIIVMLHIPTICLQVVARYGYMDSVDHGPEYIEGMCI